MKNLKVLIGSLILVVACSTSTKETPSGLKFSVLKAGDGKTAKPGEILVFNFLLKDSKDSVWIDTYKEDYPRIAKISDSSRVKEEDGLSQMLRMISKGDSITCSIPVKEFFGDVVKQPIPFGVDSTLDLHYYLSASEVLDEKQFAEYREKTQEKVRLKYETLAKEQNKKDSLIINEYLTSKNITATTLPSGIRYVITQPGQGANATTGQTVEVNYIGSLLNGDCFDTNIKSIAIEKGVYDSAREAHLPYEPFEVTIDRSDVIAGWHEALKVLNKGAKGTFYIPSALAYGPQRRGEKILENSVLIFDIELVNIK